MSKPVVLSKPEIHFAIPQVYRIKAYHITEKLRLKDIRDLFAHPPIEYTNYELVIRYSEDSFLFVYNFGSLVFFNVPDDVQERELGRFQTIRGAMDISRTSDLFFMEARPADFESQEPVNRVYFDRLVVSQVTYEKIKIVSILLAESTALEYYEILIENLLEQANSYSKRLEREGRVAKKSDEWVKFIGMCLNMKQEIISNLYIVDSPDETWESVELDKIFQEVKTMMEIDIRYRALEYKIKIIQESIEIFVDLLKSRKETILELAIIFLIAFDILLSLLHWGK